MNINTFDNRYYIILDTSETGSINFNEVLESEYTLRFNEDKSKTFVCYESVGLPSSLSTLTTKQGPYSNNEILNIITGS